MVSIYVFYADVFFCTNFVLNICVFLLAGWLNGSLLRRSFRFRMLVAAFCGALAVTAFLSLTKCYQAYVVVAHILVIPGMVRMGFAWQNRMMFVRQLVMCYGITLLLGGCEAALAELLHVSGGGIGMAFLVVIVCMVFLQMFCRKIRMKKRTYGVLIQYGIYHAEAVGLLDSGNLLHNPIFQKPVHIISRRLAQSLHLQSKESVGRMEFSTLSGNGGYVELYIADDFCLKEFGKTQAFGESVLGVAPSDFFEQKEYDVIINGELQNQITDRKGS